MRRIDFVGAPGSGKTTLLSALIAKRNSKSDWLTTKEALILASEECSKNLACQSINKFLIKTPIIKRLISKNVFNKNSRATTFKFIKNNDLYFDVVLKLFQNNSSSKEQKIIYFDNFINVIDMYAFIDHWLRNKSINVVWDESLIHKIYALIDWGNSNDSKKTLIDQYLDSIPLPDLAIYIEAKPEQILKNVLQREIQINRLEIGHYYSDSNELKEICDTTYMIAQHSKKILESKGVEIISENAEFTNESVEFINKKIINK